MIDHISLGVRDLQRSCDFYDAALGALGISRRSRSATFVSYERSSSDDFGIHLLPQGAQVSVPEACHFAFTATSRSDVQDFHAAALRHGGTDDGAPGPRPKYHSNYYAAFVKDPDGYRIEAVCHHAQPLG